MQRPFQTFLGIDLGGGRSRTTAVARLVADGDGAARVLEVTTRTAAREPFYDAALVAYLKEHAAAAALAIDAPLTQTACARCTLPICPGQERCEVPSVLWLRATAAAQEREERAAAASADAAVAVFDGDAHRARKPRFAPYAQRATDVYLQRAYQLAPRDATGPLAARACHLGRALAAEFRLHENLLEVSPRATVHQLFGAEMARRYRRSGDTWSTRAQVLERLSDELRFAVWREQCLQNDHCFDAVICAFTAFLWARDGWALPDADRDVFAADGWIWHPPPAPTLRRPR